MKITFECLRKGFCKLNNDTTNEILRKIINKRYVIIKTLINNYIFNRYSIYNINYIIFILFVEYRTISEFIWMIFKKYDEIIR